MKKQEAHKKNRLNSNDYRSEQASEFLINKKDLEIKPDNKKNNK